MDIYVGNLNYQTTEAELREAFEAYGQLSEVRLITDRYSGRSKGFAFVEMPERNEAEAALQGLNGKPLQGRTLTVNEARARGEGGGGGGGGGGGQRW